MGVKIAIGVMIGIVLGQASVVEMRGGDCIGTLFWGGVLSLVITTPVAIMILVEKYRKRRKEGKVSG